MDSIPPKQVVKLVPQIDRQFYPVVMSRFPISQIKSTLEQSEPPSPNRKDAYPFSTFERGPGLDSPSIGTPNIPQAEYEYVFGPASIRDESTGFGEVTAQPVSQGVIGRFTFEVEAYDDPFGAPGVHVHAIDPVRLQAGTFHPGYAPTSTIDIAPTAEAPESCSVPVSRRCLIDILAILNPVTVLDELVPDAGLTEQASVHASACTTDRGKRTVGGLDIPTSKAASTALIPYDAGFR
jgi:hypothetical protein